MQYGYTPLLEAVAPGHVDAVRLLIDAGADKEAKNKVCSQPCSGACLPVCMM